MREAMERWGYDLSEHRARVVHNDDLEWAERVIYMDGGNYKRLVRDYYRQTEKFRNLGQWCFPATKRIPDPAFMRRGSEEFELVVRQLVQASNHFVLKPKLGRMPMPLWSR